MYTDKTTARIVGALFIIATATAIVGGSLLLPLEEPDYLVAVAADEGQVVTGVLLELILVMSVFGIAVLLFPVLKRRNEGLALSYVGARVLEGVLLLAATVSALLILALSQDYGTSGVAGVEPLGDLLLAARDWTYLLGSVVVFGTTALILYSLLYQSRLVPVWLSLWGLAGGALILVRGLIEMYGAELSGVVQGVFAAPIAVQEMVLAVWLIVKGFSTPVLTPRPTVEPGPLGA